MTKADLITNLSNTISEEGIRLGTRKAKRIVDVVFGSITEALKDGETVHIAGLGTFEVVEHNHKPTRAWLLGRVRVTYRKRKFIRFTPGELNA